MPSRSERSHSEQDDRGARGDRVVNSQWGDDEPSSGPGSDHAGERADVSRAAPPGRPPIVSPPSSRAGSQGDDDA